MAGVQRHPQFVAWMHSIVHRRSDFFLGEDSRLIRQGIDALIDTLAASDGPLAMPQGKQLAGTRFDLHELRWPPLPRGAGPNSVSGIPIIRVLYGYARPVRDPTMRDVAVILLGGNKSPTVDNWYNAAVPEAESRLVDWCDEYLAYVPREGNA